CLRGMLDSRNCKRSRIERGLHPRPLEHRQYPLVGRGAKRVPILALTLGLQKLAGTIGLPTLGSALLQVMPMLGARRTWHSCARRGTLATRSGPRGARLGLPGPTFLNQPSRRLGASHGLAELGGK